MRSSATALYQLGSALFTLFKSISNKRKTVSKENARLLRVSSKYSDDLSFRIARREFWEGQSADELEDSLGRPDAVDVIGLKTKHRQIWKYGLTGANRYRLRITLDDGIVATWTKKS